MVDTVLGYSPASRDSARVQVIFVGDVDQLPVGRPGSVLLDLIRSGAVAVVTSPHHLSSAERSRIVVNAHRVNQGEMPLSDPDDPSSDFFFIDKSEPEEILATVKILVKERILASSVSTPLDDVQVLTPMHKACSERRPEPELQALMNPEGPTVTRGTRVFRRGDKIMQIRNNYESRRLQRRHRPVASIDEAERTLTALFDGRA